MVWEGADAGPNETFAVAVDKIDSGNVGTTKLVDVDTSALLNGTIADVVSVGALFELLTSPPAAVVAATDGITIVQPTAINTHRWVRREPSNARRFELVAAWILNATTGNDDNDGVTAPLKTLAELARRLDGATIVQATTIDLQDGTFGDIDFPRTTIDAAASVLVSGTMTNAGSRAFTAVTATTPATNTRGLVADAVPLWVDKSRLLLVSAASPMFHGLGYVTRIVSGTQANVSRWALFATPLSTTPTIGEPAPGDFYVAETYQTTIGEVRSGWQGDGEFVVRDCHVTGNVVQMPGSYIVPRFMHCQFDPAAGRLDFDYSEVFLLGCQVRAPVSVVGSVVACRATVFCGDVTVDYQGSLQTAYCQCFDGAKVVTQNGGVWYDQLLQADVQFVDIAAGDAVTVSAGSVVQAAVSSALFWGANNADASSINVHSGGGFFYHPSAKPQIPGGATDVIIGGVSKAYADVPFVNAAVSAALVDIA